MWYVWLSEDEESKLLLRNADHVSSPCLSEIFANISGADARPPGLLANILLRSSLSLFL